jgi:hypothetical protein
LSKLPYKALKAVSLSTGGSCLHCRWIFFCPGLLVKWPHIPRTVVLCEISFSWFFTFRRFRGFTKPSELLGFYLNQNPNFEPFMVLHITSVRVSCLDIIPSGPLLTLCPLNKTEQLVGDQNLIQGSPPLTTFSLQQPL